ncbi:MAG: hypothetical protein RIB98_06800 [Acidimicrobiales bacterium]
MSDTSQGDGWWQASDGKWYPPETHPDYTAPAPSTPPGPPPTSPPSAFPDPTAAMSTAPTGTATPLWKKPVFLAIAGVLVLAGAIAAFTLGSDDDDPSDTATTDASTTTTDEVDATTTTAADDATTTTAGTDTTTTVDDDTTTTGSGADDTTTTLAETTTTSGAGPGADTCTYAGLDDFEDIQLELVFTSPFDADLLVTMGLIGGDGIRFMTSNAYIEAASAGEQFRLEHDTIDELPAGVSPDDIECQVLEIESNDFGDPDPGPASGDTCVVNGVDSFGDIQVVITVANPFDETTDLSIDYALRDADGARRKTLFTTADVVAPGESVRVDADTVTDPIPGTDTDTLTCDILAIGDFGF